MNVEETAFLKDLLSERRLLSLSVLVDGTPYVGLLPFAMLPDFSAALIHASKLAKHTAGLQAEAQVSFLVHAPDHAGADPLQIPRLIMQATVHPMDKGGNNYAAAREIYVAKFPESEMIFSLGDFNLYELVPQKGRFVIGFGRALNVTGEHLRALA